MFDWQAISVALIILAALLYTGRRALSRLRSFTVGRRSGNDASSCATGCGKCGDEATQPARPARTLVQISPERSPDPKRQASTSAVRRDRM